MAIYLVSRTLGGVPKDSGSQEKGARISVTPKSEVLGGYIK